MMRLCALLLLVTLAGCGGRRPWVEPVTGMEFVWIPAGSFVMGSGPGEPEDIRPAPQHEVRITRGFYMSRYEITQEQWQRVMGANPSQFPQCGPDCPIETVTWNDVRRFLTRLMGMSGVTGLRLPTEAEWEYACRAGTTGPFSTGSDLTTDAANYDGRMPYPGSPPGEFRGSPMPVGSFAPNAWGLYDMHGNVWEYVADWWHRYTYKNAPLNDYCPYANGPVDDPVQQCGSGLKNIRGGSWYFSASSARCGRRYTHDPADRGFSIGFRMVRDIP